MFGVGISWHVAPDHPSPPPSRSPRHRSYGLQLRPCICEVIFCICAPTFCCDSTYFCTHLRHAARHAHMSRLGSGGRHAVSRPVMVRAPGPRARGEGARGARARSGHALTCRHTYSRQATARCRGSARHTFQSTVSASCRRLTVVSEAPAAQALAGPGGDGWGPAAGAHAAPVVHVAECGDLVLCSGYRFLLVGFAQHSSPRTPHAQDVRRAMFLSCCSKHYHTFWEQKKEFQILGTQVFLWQKLFSSICKTAFSNIL
jgi:hypothetical protein